MQGHTPMEENEMSDTDRKTISCFPSTDLSFCAQSFGCWRWDLHFFSKPNCWKMGNRVIGSILVFSFHFSMIVLKVAKYSKKKIADSNQLGLHVLQAMLWLSS